MGMDHLHSFCEGSCCARNLDWSFLVEPQSKPDNEYDWARHEHNLGHKPLSISY